MCATQVLHVFVALNYKWMPVLILHLGVHGLHERGAAACADLCLEGAQANDQAGNISRCEVGRELCQLQ